MYDAVIQPAVPPPTITTLVAMSVSLQKNYIRYSIYKSIPVRRELRVSLIQSAPSVRGPAKTVDAL